MATSTGNQLAQSIRQGMKALKEVCQGVDENTASRAPKGRWSPKEILSHLLGPKDLASCRSCSPFSTGRPPRSILNLRILFSPRSVPG